MKRNLDGSRQAFRIRPRALIAPEWIAHEPFDITATTDQPRSPNEILEMLQGVLTERFAMRARWETRRLPVYALVRAEEDGRVGPNRTPRLSAPVDGDGVTIFTAVREQLGLKLEPRDGPVQVLVIDSIERPTPD